jgi:hypothetical protein
MSTRRSLLRGAAALALAAAILGSGTLVSEAHASTMNKPNVDGLPEIPGVGEIPGLGTVPGLGEIPGLNGANSGHGDIGDIPIIGDVANTFKDAEPEEIVSGAIQFAGFAAETAVPLIRQLAGK